MSQDRLRQIRRGFADDASQGDEPPDLGPLRAIAEREEFADAAGRLADAYGRRRRITCCRWIAARWVGGAAALAIAALVLLALIVWEGRRDGDRDVGGTEMR